MSAKLELAHDGLNEQAVLGGIMVVAETAKLPPEVYEIAPEDFYDPRHAKIFLAMQELREEKVPIDLVTVHRKLGEWEFLKEIKPSYLVELTDRAPITVNLASWCKMLIKLSRFRNARCRISEAVTQSDQGAGAEQLASSVMDAVRDMPMSTSMVPIKEIMRRVNNKLDAQHKNPRAFAGRRSGFGGIDAVIGGLSRGSLIIIAARPSMGKTSLVLDILRRADQSDGESFLFFSAEMSSESVGQRMLAAESGVHLSKLVKGKLSQSDYSRLSVAMNKISQRKLHISDRVSTIEGLEATARRYAASGVSLIAVDYLQLLSTGSREANREREVSTISRKLKLLAVDLDVPIIVLAQLNRQVESRDNKRPQLSDIRESGSVEQDADICGFLYREGYYTQKEADRESAELGIAKNRNGPTGIVNLLWDAEFARFGDSTHPKRRADDTPPPWP